MDILYAPWRSKYINSNKEKNKVNDDIICNNTNNSENCVFCKILKEADLESNFVLKKTNKIFILLNLYPYNAGHILLLPLEHKKNIYDLPTETRLELINYLSETTKIITTNLNSDGINCGINLGAAAGAGIPSHLHFHVVPRWNGDTNFLPIIGETKQISVDLKSIFEKLKVEFDKI